MSYNDPRDVEANLQSPPVGIQATATPPATVGLLGGPAAQAAVQVGVASAVAVTGLAPGVSSGPLPASSINPPPPTRAAALQMVPPLPPTIQTISALLPQAPLISNTQTALQQNPTGTLTNVSTMTPA